MENFPIFTSSLSVGTIGWIRGQEIEIEYSKSRREAFCKKGSKSNGIAESRTGDEE